MLRKQTNPSYPLHVLCQDAENLSNNAIQECLQQISDINALDEPEFGVSTNRAARVSERHNSITL
jgi:hypothetical protein